MKEITTWVYDTSGTSGHIVYPDGTIKSWEDLREKYLPKNEGSAASPASDSGNGEDRSKEAAAELWAKSAATIGIVTTHVYDRTGALRKVIEADGTKTETPDSIGERFEEDGDSNGDAAEK